ncbi:MAG: ACT domain-containing protein [Luteolibacter sp.]
MTILGADRPGLVRSLADGVAAQGGNWLESRMARLAGQFAGIVRVECAADKVDALLTELGKLESSGLTIQAVREEAAASVKKPTLSVEVMGNDRPGIVRELSAAIVQAGGNVEELTTGLESAPMSGQPMFRAHVLIGLSEGADDSALISAIEGLSSDLTVDVAQAGVNSTATVS